MKENILEIENLIKDWEETLNEGIGYTAFIDLKSLILNAIKKRENEIIKEVEELKDLCPEIDGPAVGCSYCNNKPENKTIDKVIKIINDKTNQETRC